MLWQADRLSSPLPTIWQVWSPDGTLLGKIILPNGDGCANLVFGPPGKLYIFGEKRLYEARIAAKGVLVA